MNKQVSGNNANGQGQQTMRLYTPAQELTNNIPYIAMIVLGTVILVAGFGNSAWGLIAAGAYLIYGLAGAFWIMIFLCPYCRYFDTRSCPCGYGRIATKLRAKQAVD